MRGRTLSNIREKNANLGYEMRIKMLNDADLFASCTTRSSGKISFFTRQYKLQKLAFIKSTKAIIEDGQIKDVEIEPGKGLNEQGFKHMVALFSNYIKRSDDNHNYGTITFRYEVSNNGSGVKMVGIDKELEKHYGSGSFRPKS